MGAVDHERDQLPRAVPHAARLEPMLAVRVEREVEVPAGADLAGTLSGISVRFAGMATNSRTLAALMPYAVRLMASVV